MDRVNLTIEAANALFASHPNWKRESFNTSSDKPYSVTTYKNPTITTRDGVFTSIVAGGTSRLGSADPVTVKIKKNRIVFSWALGRQEWTPVGDES